MARKLHTHVIGQGPPLVLLHGWASNRTVFNALAEHLSARFSVHLVDLPGHGRSHRLRTPPSATAMAERVLDAVPAEAIWLGWSLGGLVALAAARCCDVRGIVLVASSPRMVRSDDWPHAMDEGTLRSFSKRLQSDYDAALWDYLALQLPRSDRNDPTVQALHASQSKEAPSRSGIVCAENVLLSTDLRHTLRHIDVPALLITGTLDAMVPAKAAADIKALWPGIHHAPIRGAGHSPLHSHAHEFGRILDQILKAIPNPTKHGLKQGVTAHEHDTLRDQRGAIERRAQTLLSHHESRSPLRPTGR